jgi:hypothetical protein
MQSIHSGGTQAFYPDIYNQNKINNRLNPESIFRKDIEILIKDILDKTTPQISQTSSSSSSLSREYSSQRECSHRCDSFSDSLWSIFFISQITSPSRQEIHIHNGHSYQQASGDAEQVALRIVIGIAAGVIGLAGSYFIGQHWSKLQESNAERKKITNLLEKCKIANEEYQKYQANRPDKTPHKHFEDLTKVLEQYDRNVLAPQQRNTQINLAASVAIVAGATLVLVGAVVASAPLMIASGATGLLALGVVVVKWGVNSVPSTRQARQIQTIQRLCRELLASRTPFYSYRYIEPTYPKTPAQNPEYIPSAPEDYFLQDDNSAQSDEYPYFQDQPTYHPEYIPSAPEDYFLQDDNSAQSDEYPYFQNQPTYHPEYIPSAPEDYFLQDDNSAQNGDHSYFQGQPGSVFGVYHFEGNQFPGNQ